VNPNSHINTYINHSPDSRHKKQGGKRINITEDDVITKKKNVEKTVFYAYSFMHA